MIARRPDLALSRNFPSLQRCKPIPPARLRYFGFPDSGSSGGFFHVPSSAVGSAEVVKSDETVGIGNL